MRTTGASPLWMSLIASPTAEGAAVTSAAITAPRLQTEVKLRPPVATHRRNTPLQPQTALKGLIDKAFSGFAPDCPSGGAAAQCKNTKPGVDRPPDGQNPSRTRPIMRRDKERRGDGDADDM